jgi:hypothetical protein
MNSKRKNREFEENASEVTMDELRDFLEGDVVDVGANPEFKEALRSKLWDLVQAKIGRSSHHGGGD